jgi:hypothetical protein
MSKTSTIELLDKQVRRLFQHFDLDEVLESLAEYADEQGNEAGENPAEDHWSSPNGCHEDCPACAAEAEWGKVVESLRRAIEHIPTREI